MHGPMNIKTIWLNHLILDMLLQTILGIKKTGVGNTHNNDTINLIKPAYHDEFVLDDLINSFLKVPYMIYKNII
jgi:hypothetical protein